MRLVICIGLVLAIVVQCLELNSGKKSVQPVIFNIGDSLSDTGGYEAATGQLVRWPYGRVFFDHPAGRMCDGRLIIDFLCESLNTTFLRPYLESLGQNDFHNGANFAAIGAETLPWNYTYNLGVQISQFLRFRSRSIYLRSIGFEGYTDEEGFNNALYIVDIGGNDLFHAFSTLSYEEACASSFNTIDEIKTAILILLKQGARNLWVPNSHPLGCLPTILSSVNVTEGELDKYGCLISMNNITTLFNDELRKLCQNLQSEFSNSTIVYLDIYSIRFELIANPSKYGFKYTTTACCGNGGLPYNSVDGDLTCGVEPYNVCENGAEYVSWNGAHYTEAANAATADAILSGNYSTPPLSFDFFLNNELAGLSELQSFV